MDEQQIIDDILDAVYGYNVILKDGDEEVIAQKKKEREEKYNEIQNQINIICVNIEKELKSALGIDDVGIKKHIRASVLTLIKTEVENGNKVIDSNGKINTGKVFDIVNQTKEEILEKIESENESLQDIHRENSAENRSQNDNEFNNINDFFEEMDSLGVGFTEEDKDTVRKAIDRANEVIKCIDEKVESGMTEDEAWKQFTEGMSPEEIKELEMQFVLADVATNFTRKKNDNREDNITEEKKVEGAEVAVTSDQKDGDNKGCENYRNMAMRAHISHSSKEKISTVTKGPIITNHRPTPSDITQLGSTIQKMMINNATQSHFQNYYPEDMLYSYGNMAFSMDVDKEDASFDVETNEYFVQSAQEVLISEQATRLIQGETIIDEEQSQGESNHRRTQLSGNEKKEGASTPITTPTDTSFVYTKVGNEKRIPEEIVEALFSGKGVDMSVAPFDINKITASASKPEMTETTLSISGAEEMLVDEDVERQEAPSNFCFQETYGASVPTSKSIVEEITVDESSVTQEGQSEPRKSGFLSARDIMVVIQKKAEMQKMLEVNGIIHRQVSGEHIAEKNATQGASVVDDDEKSGGEAK